LPENGNSTPAIWRDAIFLTAQEGKKLVLIKISKKTRAIEWTREVGEGETPRQSAGEGDGSWRGRQKFHASQNLASPSPATDGERVVVHFGNGDLAAYDFAGNRLWKRNLQEDHGTYSIWWGHANSPVLHEGLVISVSLQDSLADLRPNPVESYVVAHDIRTGEKRWYTARNTGAESEPCDSYTTPVFRSTQGGVEMIVTGGTWIDGYDPSTGKRLWWLPDLGGNRTITGPALAEGRIFQTVGMRGPVLAVKLEGSGKLPETSILWRHEQATPDTACLVHADGRIFLVNDGGMASALDARTGERLWKEKLPGDYRASPLAAEGRIYFLSTSGLATIVPSRGTFEKLAENRIPDEFLASPAVSDGRLYLRGRRALYCIESMASKAAP
jgi:outer membrane protein assembly factor BamB